MVSVFQQARMGGAVRKPGTKPKTDSLGQIVDVLGYMGSGRQNIAASGRAGGVFGSISAATGNISNALFQKVEAEREQDAAANLAAHDTYASEIMARAYTEASANNAFDKDIFFERLGDVRETWLSGIPENQRKAAEARWADLSSRYTIKLDEGRVQQQEMENNATIATAMDTHLAEMQDAARDGDPAREKAAFDALSEYAARRTDIGPVQRQAFLKKAQDGALQQHVVGVFDDELKAGLPRARKFIDDLRSGDTIKDPAQRDKAVNYLEALYRDRENDVKRDAAAAEKERTQARADWYRVADIEIQRGDKGHAFIQESVDQGNIRYGGPEWHALTETADRVAKQAAERAVGIAAANAVEAGTGLPVPNDIKFRKGVDDAFNEWQATAAPRNPIEWNAEAQAKVDKWKVIPKAIENRIAALQYGDAKAQIVAADLYGRMVDTVPELIMSKADDRTFARASLLNSLMRSGHTPEAAVKSADELLNPANVAQRDARENLYKEEFTGAGKSPPFTASNIVDKALDPGLFVSEPAAAATVARIMADEATAEHRRMFELTGDKTTAENYALKSIRATWGASRITGTKTAMKHPPEKYYGEGDWLQKQLSEFVSASGGNPEKVMVVSDPETARKAAEGRPDYVIYSTDANGMLVNHGRWMPDTDRRSKEVERAQKERERREIEKLDRAQKAQKRELEAAKQHMDAALKSGNQVAINHARANLARLTAAPFQIDVPAYTEGGD